MLDVEAGALVREALQNREAIVSIHRVAMKGVRRGHIPGNLQWADLGENIRSLV